MVEVVITRFREDLNWLPATLENLHNNGYDTAVFIYNKGEPMANLQEGLVINLRNVGREAHTYAYHMVHFQHPRNVTLYVQGNPFNGQAEISTIVLSVVNQAMSFGIGASKRIDNYDSKFHHPNDGKSYDADPAWVPIGLPLGPWINKILDKHPGLFRFRFPKSCVVQYIVGADFAVHSSLQVPKPILLSIIEDLSTSSAVETGHYMERLWFWLFYSVRADSAFANVGFDDPFHLHPECMLNEPVATV